MEITGRKTALYEAHLKCNARMMNYAGWLLPSQYGNQRVDSDEVRAVRNAIGMFDVSHMGVIEVRGNDALKFLEELVTRSMDMPFGTSRYGLILGEDGLPLDDCITTRLSARRFIMVANAANTDNVLDWMEAHRKSRKVGIFDLRDRVSLIALQGPRSEELLREVIPGSAIPQKSYTVTARVPARVPSSPKHTSSFTLFQVARSGYTGEDGFECFVPSVRARALWEFFLESGKKYGLTPCGLLARDILRKEAGMPLFGNELRHDPFTEDLGRFVDMKKEFIGKAALPKEAVTRIRKGFWVDGRSPQQGDPVVNDAGEVIGEISSAGHSPTLKRAIAMGYIDRAYAVPETSVVIIVKGKSVSATVCDIPFYRKKKKKVRSVSPAQVREMKTVYEKSGSGKTGYRLPRLDVPRIELPESYARKVPANLPRLSEPEVVSHYLMLSERTYGGDHFIPLGSCTMKYNPPINDELANLRSWRDLHPLSSVEHSQGALKIRWELERYLSALTGFPHVSVLPFAGAQSEFTALLMFKSYHLEHGDKDRSVVVIPDSAHGTNPASVRLVGWSAKEIKTKAGRVDLELLGKTLDELGSTFAGFMITNPNTLGLSDDVRAITDIVHARGGLVYYDGANTNAFLGRIRPHEAYGVDAMHLNLHKTFSVPHGGGGAGAGVVCVAPRLESYLPMPLVREIGQRYELSFDRPHSVGSLGAFGGNFAHFVRTAAYILAFGCELSSIADVACANAEYLKTALIRAGFSVPYAEGTMHEFVVSLQDLKEKTGVSAMDFVKRLMDHGFHPPTVYFPLPAVVQEALLIEPTESADQETLNRFVAAMVAVKAECARDPELVKTAPHTTVVRRVDQVYADRKQKVVVNVTSTCL